MYALSTLEKRKYMPSTLKINMKIKEIQGRARKLIYANTSTDEGTYQKVFTHVYQETHAIL